jgi:hypothetical protein
MRSKKSRSGNTSRHSGSYPSKDLRSARQTLRLLREAGGSGQDWYQPSSDAATRWKAIPLLDESLCGRRPHYGQVISDSWSSMPRLALRDVEDGHVRRLELRSGFARLEIVAERARGHWKFVARVYAGRLVQHAFILRVGRLKLLAGSGGFYHWSSAWVPRTIHILSYEDHAIFDGVKW